jgi:hypothetical protein
MPNKLHTAVFVVMLFDIGGNLEGITRSVCQLGAWGYRINKQLLISGIKGTVMMYNAVLYLLCIDVTGCFNGKMKSVYLQLFSNSLRPEINKVSKYRSAIYCSIIEPLNTSTSNI